MSTRHAQYILPCPIVDRETIKDLVKHHRGTMNLDFYNLGGEETAYNRSLNKVKSQSGWK